MKSLRLLQTLITVLPVFTAGLYLLGLSYNQGYLLAFGIDDSVFPLSSDKALFNGFIELLALTFPGILYTVVAFGAFVILVLVAAILSSTERVKRLMFQVTSWVERKRPSAPITSSVANELVDKSAAVYGYAIGLSIVLVLVLVIAAFSAKSGREQADKEISEFKLGNATSAQVFSPELPAPATGKLVVCGDKYCAFWAETGTLLIKHEAIQKVILSVARRKPASGPKNLMGGAVRPNPAFERTHSIWLGRAFISFWARPSQME